ncbi:MAG: hypothetical protein RL242_3449, partial [Pseudomonadota bacterium]
LEVTVDFVAEIITCINYNKVILVYRYVIIHTEQFQCQT